MLFYLKTLVDKLRNLIKGSGSILVSVGTLELLFNEFIFESSSSRTIIFAVVDFVGLINLAFAFFGTRSKKASLISTPSSFKIIHATAWAISSVG